MSKEKKEKLTTKDLLLKFSAIPGPSGYEDEVLEEIKTIMSDYSDECFRTPMGSLVCVKKGAGPKIGFFAHADQIAFVVTKIYEDGFLRLSGVGGWDPKTVVSQKVWIHTKKGKLRGIVGFMPPHLQTTEESKKVPDYDHLFVDVTMNPNWKDISIGDLVTLDIEGFEKNGTIFAPALDNRASCVAIIKAAELLSKINTQAQVYYIFSTQEEIGGPGAKSGAYISEIEYGIVIDVTHGDEDIPGYPKIKMGEGPAVAVGPVTNKKFVEHINKVAGKYNIKLQIEPIPGRSGTDTDEVQLTRIGVKTALISIPLKYMHNPYEKITVKDVEDTAKLLAFTAAEITEVEKQ
ncbi:M42 family metallopeptidase [Fervidobacterium nodosum]|uniref:Peptidase M42 family protein n=1 Tax=Fervidobacterium nodosum (strain ATCC 35602 / DSM 5306 / Rt17-B1) TaxID=381764 RepID=A7HLZ1_FERNB|nr:M20/M25/M40 family metallo-hydrolase [Fervidobacterium nodosum]ABS60924.1 peptidase M42 family protein [Fervidobacterium nodosum Rt17-B1]